MLKLKKLLAKILGALDYWRTPSQFITIPTISCPTGITLRNLGNFTLPHKGNYLVKVEGWFTYNGTGTRRMEISTTSGGPATSLTMIDNRAATNYGSTFMSAIFLYQSNADNVKLYISGYQNSGASLTFEGRVQYIRLR